MTRNSPPSPWQPRFGLGSLMLVILVCCLTATAGRYLVQALSAGTSARAIFLLFVLSLPALLLLVVSGLRMGVRFWRESKR